MTLALLLLASVKVQSQVPTTPTVEIPRPYSIAVDQSAIAEVKFEIKRGVQFQSLACKRTCNGNKHLAHGQCDESCDSACEWQHDREVRSFATMYRWREEEIDAALRTFGITYGAGAGMRENLIAKVEQAIGNEHQYVLPILDRHWAQPCSETRKIVREARVTYIANVTLKRQNVRPDGTIAIVDGPTIKIEVGTLVAPVDFLPSTNVVQCLCAIVQESYPDEDCEEFGGVFIDPDTNDGKEEQQFCNGTMQQQFGLTCSVASMTECTFTATNPTDKAVEICIYTGTELECKDDSYQNMGTCGVARLVLPPALAGPSLPSTASVKVRVACLNMNKREPRDTVKFKIGGPLPLPLRLVARFGEKERFKSVVEQMRTWILTDQATLAEMQKHLMFPKPSPGQYMRALETVGTIGRIDLSNPTFRKCLDPNLIGGGPSTTEAVENFVELLEKVNSPGLARAASQPTSFVDLWADGAKSYGPQHAAQVAVSLGASINPAIRQSATKLLLEGVPDSARADVAKASGLAGVSSWLFDGDAEWARRSLEVIRAYRSPSSIVYLLNPNESLPDELKMQCKAMAAELAKPPNR